MYVIGILVGAWPCGTIAMINELYGAVHTFIYENSANTKSLGKL